MTAMKVMLDDGTSVEVPARRREIRSRQISARPRPSTYMLEPLPHPDYDFIAVIGGFRGYPKEG